MNDSSGVPDEITCVYCLKNKIPLSENTTCCNECKDPVVDENDMINTTLLGKITFDEFIDRSTLDDDVKEYIKKEHKDMRELKKKTPEILQQIKSLEEKVNDLEENYEVTKKK